MAKTLDPPSWSSAGDVIGYTFKQELNSHVLRNFGLFIDASPLDRYPSVYYRHGHATLDHEDPDNIGWVGSTSWQCLFFGNVDNTAVENRPHGKDRDATGEAYSKNMSGRFANYCVRGVWAPAHGVQDGLRLLEIWKRSSGGILIHPSRNRFYWIGDLKTKSLLHTLATTKKLMNADRQDANRMQSATPQRPVAQKMQNRPHP